MGVCEAKGVARADAACLFGKWFRARCKICTLIYPREYDFCIVGAESILENLTNFKRRTG